MSSTTTSTVRVYKTSKDWYVTNEDNAILANGSKKWEGLEHPAYAFAEPIYGKVFATSLLEPGHNIIVRPIELWAEVLPREPTTWKDFQETIHSVRTLPFEEWQALLAEFNLKITAYKSRITEINNKYEQQKKKEIEAVTAPNLEERLRPLF